MSKRIDEIVEKIRDITANSCNTEGCNGCSSINKELIELLKSFATEIRESEREKIKQLAGNLKVNINSDVDTRTMEYKSYLQRKGHNGALSLLIKGLSQPQTKEGGQK